MGREIHPRQQASEQRGQDPDQALLPSNVLSSSQCFSGSWSLKLFPLEMGMSCQ